MKPYVTWAQRHGSNRWFYLYGFAHLNASEMRIVHTLAQYVHLTVMVGAGSDPDYLEALQRRDDGNRNTLSSIFASSASTSVCAMPDTTAEVALCGSVHQEVHRGQSRNFIRCVLVTSRDLGSYQAQIASEFTYRDTDYIAASSTMLDHPSLMRFLGLLGFRDLRTSTPVHPAHTAFRYLQPVSELDSNGNR